MKSRTARAAVIGAATVAAVAGLVVAPTAFGTEGTRVTATQPADDGARVVSETWLADRTLELQIQSPAVGGTVPTRVLLPASWSQNTTRTYPVLYMLHGAGDDYTSWTRETGIEEFAAEREMIVVMPDAGRTGIVADWRRGGDYVGFQTDELMQLLQRNYHANSTRAVAGISTGGYSAMALAMHRPGTFGAAASYSGILNTTFPGMPMVVEQIVSREGINANDLWGSWLFNWGTWSANNPASNARRLRGTELYVSTGTGLIGGVGMWLEETMESILFPATETFTLGLRIQGVSVETNLVWGGAHLWSDWEAEFQESWPMFAEALGLPE
ncbi:alpha/beta hydrolase-fold protein [Streptomyces sp. DSM 44917]|uniref:Alpha/beta hydrolase-fold protein n=1 Tax=Streptomyces boetiae TaxID=3075541 RepID=A0ABU2L483_9ACTN|nr:alpha/beta hydrolase-fold protein [Streptomyces sp. DSM 44917]MDT0306369.1 alpha/beta hydrolase-fold protein [Streptomyces sp. DSM 44917]